MLSPYRLLCQVSTRPRVLWSPRLMSSSPVMYKDDTTAKKRLHPARTMAEMSLEEIDTPLKKSYEKSLVSETLKTKRLDPIDAVNTGTHIPKDWRKMKLPDWKRQKYALAEKFEGQKWNPNKKLSRETMQSVRILKAKLPDLSASELSQHFEVSVEAIRRILKSKWAPKHGEEEDKVMERWKKRKERVKMATKEEKSGMEKVSEFKNIVILDSGNDYTKVKTSHSTRAFLDAKRGKKGNSKSRLFKTQRNDIRKMEF